MEGSKLRKRGQITVEVAGRGMWEGKGVKGNTRIRNKIVKKDEGSVVVKNWI